MVIQRAIRLEIGDKRISDTELSDYHARISPKGRITYFLYYRHNGKQQNVKLSTHPEITPAQARDAAKAASASSVQGVDSHEQKKSLKLKREDRSSLHWKHFSTYSFHLGIARSIQNQVIERSRT